jgi:hypothetical protein
MKAEITLTVHCKSIRFPWWLFLEGFR